MKRICAIYTRKSTDERLDMEFNTLDAQRESCEAYITSQKSEGWITAKGKYDDGGFSGGSLERPALKKLLDDIRQNKVHIIVVYKIDRLTRSLMDFAKLVDIFDEYGVTFVSITQSFNTTTSMGRLTLNVLLSFAQFEREVAGERIRDKIAASKARGMWVGGIPPVGYKIEYRQLSINPDEVALARHIFDRYLTLGNVRSLKAELDRENIRSPQRKSLNGKPYGGCLFSRGALHWILKNPAYIGKICHKGKIYQGLHEGIIPLDIWEQVQSKLKDQTHERTTRTQRRFMLQGLVYDKEGTLYGPVFTTRHGRQYCYYVSQNLVQWRDHPHNIMARLPAYALEAAVEKTLRDNIHKFTDEDDDLVLKELLERHPHISTHDLVRICVERVLIDLNQMTLKVKTSGFHKLVEDHLKLRLQAHDETFDIIVPLKIGRARRGAIVIKPDTADIFDLPAHKIKKLVQGFLWRDEHFSGLSLRDIAARENCSEAYVGTAIFESFSFGMLA